MLPSNRSLNDEINSALGQVIMQGASDLHITLDSPPMLRIDGSLQPLNMLELWSKEKLTSLLLNILSPSQLEKFEKELELDFTYVLEEGTRFRVNFFQQRGTVAGAFRRIPTEIAELGTLGIPESVGNFALLPRGLVLVTGPTGSGKSTTLASLIDLINSSQAKHIVSVEDPIEFLHRAKRSIINQREVGSDTHSFSAALKHVLRQDPDVILIGELRDLETISVALTAAETGHLVFATLHTQDAPQTIDRMIDVFPPHQQEQVRAQLAATLRGVVSQSLIKRANGKGRVVATEILVTTPAISNLIREGKTYQIVSSMQAGRAHGMHTMDQHLAQLVKAGTITYESAIEEAHDKSGIEKILTDFEFKGTVSHDSPEPINFNDSFSNAVR